MPADHGPAYQAPMEHAHVLAPGLSTAGDPSLLGLDPVLLAAMLLAGLVGSAMHCVGMCGPFVLTQIAAGLDRSPGTSLSAWARLKAATLIPYHLGRLSTYAGLGAVAGGIVGTVSELTGFRWILGIFLACAAAYFAAKLVGGLVRISPSSGGKAHGWITDRITAAITRRLGAAGRVGPYSLGLALGFLPCGLVYGALAAAAGSGGAVAGAAVMAAFGLGTVPGLIVVGYFGAFVARRWNGFARVAALPLYALNILTLSAMAFRAFA